MTETIMNADVLEQQAAEQRRRIHNTVQELRSTVKEKVKERLDVKSNVRQHWPKVALSLGIVGLAVGYQTAGIFARD